MRNGLLAVGLGILALALSFMTSSCGYDGSYRYACQDPTNWDSPECQPPLCEADSTCPEYLVPKEVDL
jgi:hypothetical protein